MRIVKRSAATGAVSLALLGLSPTNAPAQVDRGTIQGRVTDASGAVVPNAKVQVIQVDTNTVLELATNTEGVYTVPNLMRGAYRVTISKDGFTPGVTEGIEIRAGVQIRVDHALHRAGVRVEVVVTASTHDVSSITNSAALSQKLITELPTIVSGTKRDVTSLLQNPRDGSNHGLRG